MMPCALTPHPGIKYLPTTPFEFASPSGKRLDFDISSRRGDPRPLPHTITALAFWNTSFLSASKYTAPVTLPALSTEISRTKEFGRSSHLLDFSTMGITLTSALDFAPTLHPNPEQYPQ